MSNQTHPTHTPGPWIATNENSVYGACEAREHSPHYRKLIRPAIQTEKEAASYGGTLAEQEANAILIAAAPDLLKALEGAYQALQKAYAHDLGYDDSNFVGEWMDEAREALAKAKG